MEVTQIEMATLCDLAGLPESPRLHLASSRTKLKKNEKKKKIKEIDFHTTSDSALEKQSNSHGQMILTKSAPRQYLCPSTGQVVELRLCSTQL